MRTIRRVRQRYRSDCGVACVATIAGVSYLQAFDALGFLEGDRRLYTSHGQIAEALQILGFQIYWKRFIDWDAIPGPAILGVNHRCERRNYHWVTYDGKWIRDPNPKQPPRVRTFDRYRASGWYLLVLENI